MALNANKTSVIHVFVSKQGLPSCLDIIIANIYRVSFHVNYSKKTKKTTDFKKAQHKELTQTYVKVQLWGDVIKYKLNIKNPKNELALQLLVKAMAPGR